MLKMRQQFAVTVAEAMKADARTVLLLGDIGAYSMRQALSDYPDRAYNIGILEQAMTSMSAGLTMAGFIPIVHTIAPFLVERNYEQLKDDFGYQALNGNFVSIGASYDNSGLGCTHHCPGDVAVLKQIPNMSIIVPGTAKEFDVLFKANYTSPNPKYYRLSEANNEEDRDVVFGKAMVVKKGSDKAVATVIAVGPMLGMVLEATRDLDVTILYYTTLQPFDAETLRSVVRDHTKVIVCEPVYSGTLAGEVAEALSAFYIQARYIGVPHEFIEHYGSIEDIDTILGLTAPGIKKKIEDILQEKDSR